MAEILDRKMDRTGIPSNEEIAKMMEELPESSMLRTRYEVGQRDQRFILSKLKTFHGRLV